MVIIILQVGVLSRNCMLLQA
uniref:Uncharacterized protein n=1 Tax=Arundo donax TaxID=35708 RepID=A0A0A9B3G5_ARUDO